MFLDIFFFSFEMCLYMLCISGCVCQKLYHLLGTSVYAMEPTRYTCVFWGTPAYVRLHVQYTAVVNVLVQYVCICWGACSVCLCILGHLYCVSGICCIFLPKLAHLLGTPVYAEAPVQYTSVYVLYIYIS